MKALASRFSTNEAAHPQTAYRPLILWFNEVKHPALSACGEHLSNLRRFDLRQNATAIRRLANGIPASANAICSSRVVSIEVSVVKGADGS
jgi:hypothetical protein